MGVQVTALNFGAQPIEEEIVLPITASGDVVDMISGARMEQIDTAGRLTISLDGYAGKSLLCTASNA